MKELFRNRNYLLLFLGNLVSELGNVLFAFVAGLYVADLTGNEVMLALFMALGAGVRILAAPLAGVVVDRMDKIRVIYGTDYIRGLIYLGTAYLFWVGLSDDLAVTVLLIVVAVAAFFSAFFGPAISSATPEIVGLDKIQQANGANSIIQSITSIAGVLFGIIAFGLFSFEVAALINGISFVLSGFSEMFIRAEHKEEVPPSEVSMMEDFRIGFRYILNKEGFLAFMIFALFLNFAVAPLFSVAIPALMRIQLQRSAWEIGWLNIVFSIAMMAAGIVIGSIRLRHPSRTIRTSIFFLTMSVLFLSGAIWALNEEWVGYSLFYGLMMFAHVTMAVFMMGTNVPLNTGMVKLIDPAVRGRVFSTLGALAGGLMPLSILLSGFVIQATSVAFLGLLCSVLLLVPMLGFLMNRKVRKLLASIEPTPEAELELAIAVE